MNETVPPADVCLHPLVDVWGDSRAPIATEVTLEEGQSMVNNSELVAPRSTLYLQCCECALEIEDEDGS